MTSNTESNTNFTITNLSNSSTYYLYVKTNCSATESGPYSEVAIFNTLCDVITNYTQNFNTTLPDTLPHCWSVISSGEVYHGSNDWDGIDETYCYSLNSSWDSTPTDQLILVSPQTNDLGNRTYRIRFKAKGSSWTEETTVLNIVRLNGTTNDATITLIEALELTGTYEEYFVNLPTTTDDYFGFQHPLNGAFVPIYLEDVVYEPIPSCPNVLGLSATQDFSTLTAQLSWNGPGDNFEIEWGNQNFNFGEGTTVTNIPTNSTEITVSGEGIYSYYVRRNCGDGDFSPWTGPFNFIVGYCQSVPTSQDGDGISNISYNGTTYDLESVPYQFMTEIPVLYSNYENTSEVTFITSYPYTYHMWIDINGNGVFESSELVNSGNSLTNNSPEISSTTFELGNIPSGIYRMRFGSADSGQDTPNPCYSGSWGVTIDSNVEISSPCFLPETIEFLNITTNSSTLTTSYPNQTYTVEYGIEGFIQGNGIVLTNVSNGYTIENLESGQTYDVYLKVDCEETIVHEWSEVQQFTTLCNTPIPTGETTQILIHDQTFADIELNGENINIYATTDHQNPIPLTNTIQAGTYYATQTLDCESDSHLTVNIQVVQRVAQPTISNPYIVCESIQLNEVSLGLVNNTTVKWYETATSTVELSPNTIVNSDLTYYVTQSDQYSESLRTLVNFTISAIPPTLTTSSVVTCGNTLFNQIVLDETYQGELIWFTNELSAAPINGQTVVISGIYYVSQKINTCLSERKMIQITVNAVVPTPGANVIDICGTGIISDLDPQGVTGASFNWYSTLTSNVVLGPNTNLNTATYYVEQVINGCASQRKAVSVRVNSKVAPVVNNSSICQNTRFVDIVLPQNSGVTYKFYTTPIATSAIDINSIINTGTYYLARVSNGCESNRSAITLTVLPIPNAPTGITTQTFDNNLVTIADLEMDQENITWYITYNDAVQGTNPLLPTTPLVNGQTYYAVDTLGSCRSLPTAVLVEILLSNQSLDLTQLKIYPNPIENEVNVTYSESIDKIEIYSILGQLIQSVKPNTDQTSLEVSNLSSGTYLLKVFVGEQTQTVKVVKK